MVTDLNQYGQFYGGNSLVTSGQGICGEPRLYPNNAYYRFNKLRDEGDWPSNVTGIYYGKGDCINCPKSHLKNFKDFSWKGDDDPLLQGATNEDTLQNHKVVDINQFLMQRSKVGTADIRYKFLGPAFQRLIVGYQVFWPMQGYQNPTQIFNTNYISYDGIPEAVGFVSSPTAANNPGVGEWTKEYDGVTVQPWGSMKRKIMGDYQAPSISQATKTNMGAWYWPDKDNSFQWYINSNFNGPPKISGYSGINKKFSELRIIFDSCSVSNIENRVRVPCPSPGSHIFAGKSSLATQDLNYRFHPDAYDNQALVGCFVEYFALILTDKEKDTLNIVQLGIVEAKSGYNFYDVDGSSTFNDLLQQYGLNIQGGNSISGEASVEITGYGWPRGVNINLCSTEYFSSKLNNYMGLFNEVDGDPNTFANISCTEGDSIYTPSVQEFSGINVASDLIHSWSERQGLWTSGNYLDPPFYNGGFLRISDAEYFSQTLNNGTEALSPAGIQKYFLGDVTGGAGRVNEDDSYDSNFYSTQVQGEGASYYAISQGQTEWFCKNVIAGTPDGYFTESRGYIEKWIYLENSEFGDLVVPYRPLYFFHGFASALLTPYDFNAPGGGNYCGLKSDPRFNKINPCNDPGTDFYAPGGGFSTFLLNANMDFAHWGKMSVLGYLEDPSISVD